MCVFWLYISKPIKYAHPRIIVGIYYQRYISKVYDIISDTMEIRTQALKDMVTMANALKVGTVTVYQDDEGWRIDILDPSHIQMTRLRIPAEGLAGYAPGKPFAMSVEKLGKALNVCGETLDIEVGGNIAIRSGRVRMTIPRYDIGDAFNWPAIAEFSAECIVSSDVLREMSDASPDEADDMSMTIGEAGLSMASANDTATASAVIDVPAAECVMCEGTSQGRFAWLAWRAFLKGVPRGTELDMRTSDNYPLNVRFATQNGLQGEWVLAPGIVEE